MCAVGALLVAAASATQDIVIDAFRVESLDPSEQAAGMASYVAAYRIGMLVSTAGALFIVSGFEDFGARQERRLDASATSRWRAFVLIGMVDRICRDRARAIGASARGARRARRRELAQARGQGRAWRVLGISSPARWR